MRTKIGVVASVAILMIGLCCNFGQQCLVN